jgi:hypothetical protein
VASASSDRTLKVAGEVASLRWRHVSEATGMITIELSWEGPLKARYEDDEDTARVAPLSPKFAAINACAPPHPRYVRAGSALSMRCARSGPWAGGRVCAVFALNCHPSTDTEVQAAPRSM